MGSRLRETLKQYPSLKRIVQAGRRFRAGCRKRYARATRSGRIQRYLDAHAVRKLQIGALGNELKGWLNTDIEPVSLDVIYLDATRRFPLPDNSIDYIFSEHQIEHIEYRESRFMLRECFRVLRPGGRIRVATPDLVKLAHLCDAAKTDVQTRYIAWAVKQFFPDAPAPAESFVVNNFFYNFHHRFIFDERTLGESMTLAGFGEVISRRSGESDDEHLRGIDSHHRYVGADFNELESMILEARKASSVEGSRS